MLKLNDTFFEIKECYLDAFEDDGQLEVGLNIETFDAEFYESNYAPKFTSEILFTLSDVNLNNWINNLCNNLSFDSAYDEDGEPIAFLYLGEHLPVENLNVEISIRDDSKLNLFLTGVAECRLNGDNVERINITVNHEITFKCIWMGKSIEENWKDDYRQLVNMDEFELLKDKNDVFQLAYNKRNK